ncbi:hypothetical protein TrVE_jg9452 [Triparma verrucosa]|uniref:Uncharacterized protein n=1 Tax=Triparma verrucosa TaxID=1606542 RepID=A0A9W7CGP0_9STRA|nr:hypothetical protein TrVE_jg9452 [Triparma verrucosa]
MMRLGTGTEGGEELEAALKANEELKEQLRNLREAHEGLVGAGAADISSSEEVEEQLRSLKEAHEGLANSQDIRVSTVYCRGDSGGQFIEQLFEGTLNLRGGASDDVSNGGDIETVSSENSCHVSSKKKKKKEKKKKEKKTITKKTKTKEKKRIQTKDVLAEDKLTKQIMGKKNTKKKIKATLSSSSNSDESIRASIRSLSALTSPPSYLTSLSSTSLGLPPPPPTYSTLLSVTPSSPSLPPSPSSLLSLYLPPLLPSLLLSTLTLLSFLSSPTLPHLLTPSILRLLSTHILPSLKYISSTSHLTVYDYKATQEAVEIVRGGKAYKDGVLGCIVLVYEKVNPGFVKSFWNIIVWPAAVREGMNLAFLGKDVLQLLRKVYGKGGSKATENGEEKGGGTMRESYERIEGVAGAVVLMGVAGDTMVRFATGKAGWREIVLGVASGNAAWERVKAFSDWQRERAGGGE